MGSERWSVKHRLELRSGVVLGLLIMFLVLDPTDVPAQQVPIPLDTITTVATRVSPGLSSQTRAVELLTRKRIEELPVRTVAQALRWAFAVDVMARSAAQADISIRGSSFEQVLVLIDGVPMSDPQTGHFDLDLAVPLDQVERIEILRGPASALYGTDAMGGAVNIVTKAAAQPAAARVEGGSFGTVNASLGGGIRVGRTRLAAGAGLGRSDGHRDGTDYRVSQLTITADAPLALGKLAAQFGRSWKDFGAADFYAPFPSYEEVRTTRFAASWIRSLTPVLNVEPRFYLRRHNDHFILDRQDPEFYANTHVSSQIGGETVVRYSGVDGLRLAGGGSIARETLESGNLGDRSQDRWAIFAEAVAQLGSLTLNLGGRGDGYESHGLVASPSLSAALWLYPLRLRGSFAGSFRVPTWTERFYEDPVNRGRADLEPERSWTTEIGADLQPLRDSWISVTAFRRKSLNLIDWARRETDGDAVPWETRNVKSATFWGLEAEARGVIAGADVAVQGSVLKLSSEQADGYISKYALRPLVRDLVLQGGRSLGPIAVAASMRYRRRAGGEGHWLLDLRAAVPTGVGELYLDLLNGLGSEYEEITGVRAPGRSVLAGFRTGKLW